MAVLSACAARQSTSPTLVRGDVGERGDTAPNGATIVDGDGATVSPVLGDAVALTPGAPQSASADAGPSQPLDAGSAEALLACAGADLDLRAIATTKGCRVKATRTSPQIAPRIAPGFRVARGETLKGEFVFANRSTGTTAHLEIGWCEVSFQPYFKIFDARGRRVDEVGDCGLGGGGCGGYTIGVDIAIGGRARIPFEVSTVTTNCGRPAGPIKAGRYRLEVHSLLSVRPFVSSLLIEEPEPEVVKKEPPG